MVWGFRSAFQNVAMVAGSQIIVEGGVVPSQKVQRVGQTDALEGSNERAVCQMGFQQILLRQSVLLES